MSAEAKAAVRSRHKTARPLPLGIYHKEWVFLGENLSLAKDMNLLQVMIFTECKFL